MRGYTGGGILREGTTGQLQDKARLYLRLNGMVGEVNPHRRWGWEKSSHGEGRKERRGRGEAGEK